MKSIEEIYDSMRSRVGEMSGVAVSENGELSLRLSAIAQEIYSLYVQSDWVRRQCFPQTALGSSLDDHATLRNLERRAAASASGLLRFIVEEPAAQNIHIPAGTVCMTAGLRRFATVDDCTLAAGETFVETEGIAEELGTAGNVGAGEILVMSAPPYGITGCTNPTPFSGGQDEEDDESLRTRILNHYAMLQNGVNVGYYRTIALDIPGVAAAAVVPCARGANTLDVVITSAEGLPDATLIEQVSAAFEQRRELGIDVLVRAPETQTFNTTVYLMLEQVSNFAEIKATITSRIRNGITGAYMGKTISGKVITGIIGEVEGVRSYSVSAPATGVLPAADVLPKVNTINVISAGTVKQ